MQDSKKKDKFKEKIDFECLLFAYFIRQFS